MRLLLVTFALWLSACALLKSPVVPVAADLACVVAAEAAGKNVQQTAQDCELAVQAVLDILNSDDAKRVRAKLHKPGTGASTSDAGPTSGNLGPLEAACVLADCDSTTPAMHCNVAPEHIPEAQQLLAECLAAGEIGRRAKANAASQEVGAGP